MDEMNKAPTEGGGTTPTPINNGPVGMDGLNKVLCEGGGECPHPK